MATPLLFYFIPLSLPEIVLNSSVASAQEATTGDGTTRGGSAEQMTQRDLRFAAALRDRLFQTGVEQFYRGQLPEALATFEQVLAKSRDSGDKLGEAATLRAMAETYTWLGRSTETLKTAQQALAIYQELGDLPGKAEALYHMGDAYLGLNEPAPALDNIQQSLAIRREVRDRHGEGRTLGLLGVAQVKQGQVAQGLSTLHQSVAILRESVNTPAERKRQQFYQGVFLAWLGYTQNLPDSERKNDVLMGISLAYGSMGQAYSALKQYVEAIAATRQALSFAQQSGEQLALFLAWQGLAHHHYVLGEQLKAAGKFSRPKTSAITKK